MQVRIKLSDGSFVTTSSEQLQRLRQAKAKAAERAELQAMQNKGPSHAPSKRTVKIKSGRQGRKSYNGRLALAAVGGYRNEMDAIGAPADMPLCRVRVTERLDPVTRKMVKVGSNKDFTWDIGGNSSTGYIGGRGA